MMCDASEQNQEGSNRRPTVQDRAAFYSRVDAFEKAVKELGETYIRPLAKKQRVTGFIPQEGVDTMKRLATLYMTALCSAYYFRLMRATISMSVHTEALVSWQEFISAITATTVAESLVHTLDHFAKSEDTGSPQAERGDESSEKEKYRVSQSVASLLQISAALDCSLMDILATALALDDGDIPELLWTVVTKDVTGRMMDLRSNLFQPNEKDLFEAARIMFAHEVGTMQALENESAFGNIANVARRIKKIRETLCVNSLYSNTPVYSRSRYAAQSLQKMTKNILGQSASYFKSLYEHFKSSLDLNKE